MTVPCLRDESGRTLPLVGERWTGEASEAERSLLRRLPPPVLDVGCGPGRHVAALAEEGIPALGIDITPLALDRARHRGALVLHRSIFGRVPAAGRWGSALLLDGNIGIGGDPVALLRRLGTLVRPGGHVLVETQGPGTPTRHHRVCLELGGAAGPWFDWVDVSADTLPEFAAAAGLRLLANRRIEDRWYSVVEAGPERRSAAEHPQHAAARHTETR